MKLSKKASLVMTFVGVIFMIIGFCIVRFIGKPLLEKAQSSEKWPTTEGVIVTSEVIQKRDDNGLMYSANIVYRYSVNNQQMEGDQIWFGDNYSSSSRTQFQRIVNDYPLNKKVKVFYDPDDPVITVLQPGAFKSTYLLFAFGWGFLGMGGLILLISIILLIWSNKESLEDQIQDSLDANNMENPYAEGYREEN